MVGSKDINDSAERGSGSSFGAAVAHEFEPRGGQEAKQRTARLQSSLELLEEQQPQILRRLEHCRRERIPTALYVEGYEHSADVILAVLRCAHAYSVTLTVVPFPMATLSDLEW